MSIIKKNILLIVLLIIFLVLSFTAAASSIEFTETEVSFEADYGNFNKDEDIITENGRFSLKNNGIEEIIVNAYFENLPIDYKADDILGIVIPAQSTTEVQFAIDVPHEADSGKTEIGSVIIKEGNTELKRAKLIQNTVSMLKLKELIVEYTSSDGEPERDTFNENDEQFSLENEVKPGTKVTLTIELENLFDNDYENGELEEIKITAELDDDTDFFAEDFIEEYGMDNIAPDNEREMIVCFTIDEEAEAGDYTFYLTFEAEDDQNAYYKIEKELSLKLTRGKDDLRIVKAEIEPITALEDSFSLDFEIKNFGTRIQRYVVVNIYNRGLGIDETQGNIRIEEFSDDDHEWSKIFKFNLNPAAAGTYPLEITVYINNDEKIAFQTADLVIEEDIENLPEPEEELEDGLPAEEENEEEIEDNLESADKGNEEEISIQISSNAVVSTRENVFDMGSILAAALIISCLIVIVIIVIMFISLLR